MRLINNVYLNIDTDNYLLYLFVYFNMKIYYVGTKVISNINYYIVSMKIEMY